MMVVVSIIAFGLLWTVASIVWFFANMGKKYKKDKWYDYVLSVPALAIACVLGLVYRLRERYSE